MPWQNAKLLGYEYPIWLPSGAHLIYRQSPRHETADGIGWEIQDERSALVLEEKSPRSSEAAIDLLQREIVCWCWAHDVQVPYQLTFQYGGKSATSLGVATPN